jgi:hypothetical protein
MKIGGGKNRKNWLKTKNRNGKSPIVGDLLPCGSVPTCGQTCCAIGEKDFQHGGVARAQRYPPSTAMRNWWVSPSALPTGLHVFAEDTPENHTHQFLQPRYNSNALFRITGKRARDGPAGFFRRQI